VTIMTKKRGFTLIELLVALTIFSVVMTAVYASFKSTVDAWRDGEANMRAYQDARMALGLMAKELRSCAPIAGHYFIGESHGTSVRNRDEIEFFTIAPSLDPDRDDETVLLKVSYSLGGTRTRNVYTLDREEAGVRGKIPSIKEVERGRDERVKTEKPSEVIVAEGVTSLKFEYLWDEKWFNACEKGQGLPKLVRITMRVRDEAGMKGDEIEFTTTVAIPFSAGPGQKLKRICSHEPPEPTRVASA